jgi:hypothetical protein
MRGRYRRHRSREDIGREYARMHVEAFNRLTEELGGSVKDVQEYFFALSPRELRIILAAYEKAYPGKGKYAEQTIAKWRTGRRRMSGLVAERLFALLPPRMPLAQKYRLIENLWNHVGPRSKKTLRVGLDASIDQILEAVKTHIEEVVIQYKIPIQLERRFDWLSENDVGVKQEFLNHLRQLEKSLVVDGARIRLPELLAHLRGEAGRLTHRVADVLKIGNHELELLIEKTASGVAVVEPYVALRSPVTASFKWLWWAAAAIVVLYIFSHLPAQKSSHQISIPAATPSHQPSMPGLSQSNTHASDLPKSTMPASSSSSEPNGFSDHGPGRVACDGQWIALHRNDYEKAASGYRDFMVNCMKN